MEEYEQDKNWESALLLLQKAIREDLYDVEAYIRVIYLLHNILVEEDYPEGKYEYFTRLLKEYFNESYEKFYNNSEYLFFIGKILYISEWYFGINDDLKPIEERQAFHMQKKAFEKEPDNILFEWAYLFSLNDKRASKLAEEIILYNQNRIDWLKSKGFPGNYIIEALQQSSVADGSVSD